MSLRLFAYLVDALTGAIKHNCNLCKGLAGFSAFSYFCIPWRINPLVFFYRLFHNIQNFLYVDLFLCEVFAAINSSIVLGPCIFILFLPAFWAPFGMVGIQGRLERLFAAVAHYFFHFAGQKVAAFSHSAPLKPSVVKVAKADGLRIPNRPIASFNSAPCSWEMALVWGKVFFHKFIYTMSRKMLSSENIKCLRGGQYA